MSYKEIKRHAYVCDKCGADMGSGATINRMAKNVQVSIEVKDWHLCRECIRGIIIEDILPGWSGAREEMAK